MTSSTCLTGLRARARGKLLLAAGAAAAALALAACGGSSAPASQRRKVTLTFWSWVPGISQSVGLWNKSHPDIHVNLNEVTSGDAGSYAKMYSALQAGNAPDLGQIEYATLPNFEHVGGLIDLSKYGASRVRPDFVPWTWSQVSQGNAVYAIPQDTGPMGLFYRADLFKKYGLAVPADLGAVPERRQEGARRPPGRLHRRLPVQRRPVVLRPGLAGRGAVVQHLGRHLGRRHRRPGLQQVASYWQQLISDHLVKVEPDFASEWYKDLSDGTLLTWPTAVWGENTLVTNAASTKGDWRVAAMPNWGTANSNGNWGGSTTVVFKDSKHPAQALQFAEWLNTSP